MTINKDEEIIKKGYIPNPIITIPKDSLYQTLLKLESLPIAKKEYEVHPMSLEDAQSDANTFLSYYYKLHKVPYLYFKNIGRIKIPIIRKIIPTKLPLYSSEDKEDIFSGSVIEELVPKKRYHILFRGINLCETITEQTSSSYIHEITHTELDSIKNSIRNYYNSEIISIFNELFHASILGDNERILRLNDSRRICEMSITAKELIDFKNKKSKMTRDALLECCKYLISDLKAYNLFITFYYGDDNLKNDILDDIQAIFDGYMSVEELLSKYDITLKNSQDEKKLLKYFNR